MATADNVTTTPRQHWPHEATELYLREADRIEAINGPFGDVMLDTAALQPGERVVDVGCGHGTTTIDAAQRVTPAGAALGVDITASLLEQARQRASKAGISNVEFVTADAQTHPFHEAAFDVAISRFGIMFFDEPEAAFANLGRSVRPGGRLVIVCPHDPLQSEWVAIAFAAAAPHVGCQISVPPAHPDRSRSPTGTASNRPSRAAASMTSHSRPSSGQSESVTTSTMSPPSSPHSPRATTPRRETRDKVAAAVDALKDGFAPSPRRRDHQRHRLVGVSPPLTDQPRASGERGYDAAATLIGRLARRHSGKPSSRRRAGRPRRRRRRTASSAKTQYGPRQ